MFDFSILSLQLLMLLKSTDSQQFSAPFKAGNFKQLQTCYKPQNTTQRKLATLSGSYQFRRNGSSHGLEPQCIDIMMLAA
jgi:hypothetical protein